MLDWGCPNRVTAAGTYSEQTYARFVNRRGGYQKIYRAPDIVDPDRRIFEIMRLATAPLDATGRKPG